MPLRRPTRVHTRITTARITEALVRRWFSRPDAECGEFGGSVASAGRSAANTGYAPEPVFAAFATGASTSASARASASSPAP